MERRAAKEQAERDPKHPPLPAPDAEFWELETFREFGRGDWLGWYSQPAMVRGRLMAHLVEKSNREAYELDHKKPEKEKKAGRTGDNAFEQMERNWFSGTPNAER